MTTRFFDLPHVLPYWASRKPKSLLRTDVEFLKRYAERNASGLESQEPPRNTLCEQSPLLQASPLLGAAL